MIMNRYRKGINVGGWLSQYPSFSSEHFNNFISKEDVERIASWGFDHIRLPVDYPLLEEDLAPFSYKEEGFRYIDRFLAWCSEYGLNVVLDLHKAPGYGFFESDNTLFEDERMQARLIGIWKSLSERYSHEGENLLFELLNEVVEPDSTRWNALYPQLVQAIRESDLERWIIVGGNRYNAVGELKNLSLLEDDHIVYNFHFYEPYLFTHQRMPWVDVLRDFDKALYFPGRVTGIPEFIRNYPQYEYVRELDGQMMDRELLLAHLNQAKEFQAKHGVPLYCGEFGSVTVADPVSRMNWTREVVSFLREHGIGSACWTYKAMDFGLVDENGQVVSAELIQLLTDDKSHEYKREEEEDENNKA